MKIKITHVLLVVLIVVGILNLSKPAPAAPRSDLIFASVGARTTIAIQPGEFANCPTYFIPSSLQLVRCAPLSSTQPSVPPTSTSAITDTPASDPTETQHVESTATPSGDLQAWEVWHAPGAHELAHGEFSNVHEHGQKPPAWADEFSEAEFGHPVMYGGDERSSEIENVHKHQAYGGFNFSFAPNGCRTDGYLRYHASSTPMDRAASVHSMEIYVRDCSGNISINQGVYWTGDPATQAQRMCRNDEDGGRNGQESVTYDGRPEQVRDQYIIGARCENDTARSEQWYTHFINWDFSLTLLDATTFFHYGEHENEPEDQENWQLTGSNELRLRVEITSLPNPRVTLPRSQQYPLNEWWCAQAIPTIGTRRHLGRTLPFPFWQMTGAVENPSACPDGFLPQYNASSMPQFYGDMPGGNTIPRIQFDGAGVVTVPN